MLFCKVYEHEFIQVSTYYHELAWRPGGLPEQKLMMSSSFFFQRKPFGLFNGPQNDKTFLLLRKSVNLTTFSSLFSPARRCRQAAAAVLDLGLRRHLASIQARISLKDRYTIGP